MSADENASEIEAVNADLFKAGASVEKFKATFECEYISRIQTLARLERDVVLDAIDKTTVLVAKLRSLTHADELGLPAPFDMDEISEQKAVTETLLEAETLRLRVQRSMLQAECNVCLSEGFMEKHANDPGKPRLQESLWQYAFMSESPEAAALRKAYDASML